MNWADQVRAPFLIENDKLPDVTKSSDFRYKIERIIILKKIRRFKELVAEADEKFEYSLWNRNLIYHYNSNWKLDLE